MDRRLSICIAASAATLLCAYSKVGLLTHWDYYGTPIAGQYFDASGLPTVSEFSRKLPLGLPALPTDLAAKIAYMLPEGRDIRLNAQGLVPDSDDRTNIRFAEDADVWVSFLSEGAGYRNSVGFFRYDPANPPASPADVQEKILFPNASMPAPLDAAGTYQNTVSLGRFHAGEALGMMIVSNGFSNTGRQIGSARGPGVVDTPDPKWVFYTLRNLNPEAPGPGNLNVHTVMLKDLADSSDDYQRVVVGFEDINRESGGDHDFNDVVLAIHVTPRRAIANIEALQPLASAGDPDSDGDGVKDSLDEFPLDASRAFSRYYPDRDTWGTLAYEDMWPERGDYDLNDVVVRYRTREVMNAQRQVVGLELSYRLDARGGLYHSGFGVHLPGVAASSVASATLSVQGGAAQALAVEPGQSEAVLRIFDDAYAYLPLSSDAKCPFANTQSLCPVQPTTRFDLKVSLRTPLASSVFSSPYNPFIFRSDQRGRETHLPGKPATDLADKALFGTAADASIPAKAYTYMDSGRHPWALDIPTEWKYPEEKSDVLLAYPRFNDWVVSSGSNARDWYLSGFDANHLYRSGL